VDSPAFPFGIHLYSSDERPLEQRRTSGGTDVPSRTATLRGWLWDQLSAFLESVCENAVLPKPDSGAPRGHRGLIISQRSLSPIVQALLPALLVRSLARADPDPLTQEIARANLNAPNHVQRGAVKVG
jgi:hypothetical protein